MVPNPKPRQLVCKTGATFKAALLTPWDLTGWQITSELRDVGSRALVRAIAISTEVNPATNLVGIVRLRLEAAQTQELEAGDRYAFDVRLESGGEVYITPEVPIRFVRRLTDG